MAMLLKFFSPHISFGRWLAAGLAVGCGWLLTERGLAQEGPTPPPTDAAWAWLDGPGEADFRLQVDLQASPEWTSEDQAWIAFHFQDPEHYYAAALSAAGCRFFKVKDGRAQPLGRGAAALPLQPGSTLTVTLKRRRWEMVLIVQDQLVARAAEDEFQEGRLGLALSRPVGRFGPSFYQPAEPLFFSDDFMRLEGEEGDWKGVQGQWRIGSAREGTRADPRLSANPFFYRPTGGEGGRALATTGYWFWDNYVLQAAVRWPGWGEVGLCGYLQNQDNYLLFRLLQSAPGPQAQLVRVVHGTPTVLAEAPGPLAAGPWYHLRFVVTDERLQGFVDSRLLCEAGNGWFGQGRAGLYAAYSPIQAIAGEEEADVRFDDVRVESELTFQDDPQAPGSVAWTDVREAVQAALPAGTPLPVGPAATFRVAGDRDWRDYVLRVQVQPADESPVGVCFYYRDPANFYLLLGRPGASARKGTWELVRVVQGQAQTLAQGSGRFKPGSWQEVTVEANGGCLRAEVGPLSELTVVDPDLFTGERPPAGRVGLLAATAATQFRDVTVSFPSFQAEEPPVTAQFEAEQTMAQWASREGAWQVGRDGWVWHRGVFLDRQAVLNFPLPKCPRGGKLQALVAGRDHDPAQGYLLEATLQTDRPLTCQLKRRGEMVAQARTTTWQPGDLLTLEQMDHFVRVRLNGQPLLAYADEAPLSGEQIGFHTQNVPLELGALGQPRYGELPQPKKRKRTFLDQLINAAANIFLDRVLREEAPELHQAWSYLGLEVDVVKWVSPKEKKQKKKEAAADEKVEVAELTVHSPHFYDCTFATAPVDWRVQDGTWQVTQRWTCSPQWTFFGGRGGTTPTLWSKTAYYGDLVLDFFASKPMHLETGKDTPSDLNVTICGDGQSLKQGYSFILAGEEGQVNRILKNGKVVAEGPYSLTTTDPHRAWYYIRVEKRGGTLRFSVDDYPLLAYEDPDPLKGGPIAFWSNPQGLMIARVKIWYERAETG